MGGPGNSPNETRATSALVCPGLERALRASKPELCVSLGSGDMNFQLTQNKFMNRAFGDPKDTDATAGNDKIRSLGLPESKAFIGPTRRAGNTLL